MADVLLSIDLGTTRVKVGAFSTDGRLVSQLSRRHRELGDAAGAVWQNADGWWRDVCTLIRELLERQGSPRVMGVGLCGRGNAAVFADADGEVVDHPWSDRRHANVLAEIKDWRQRGNRDLSNYAAGMVAKYLWLARNAPERSRRIARAFYAKDWLVYRLTGAHVTDWSSGPDGDRWDPALFDELGLDPHLLPAPALPWDLAGEVSEIAAAASGLDAGTPVAVGAHDGICANVGAGACRPGDYVITLGTHAVVRAVTGDRRPGGFRFYALPVDRHVYGGNALFGGRSADWFLDLIGADPQGRESRFAQLDAAAALLQPGSDGVCFLPFLDGRVAPETRSGARAGFMGLQAGHGRDAMFRAILEGVAFAVHDIFERVCTWCGTPDEIRLTGAGARSRIWVQILADVMERPILVTDVAAEGRGAAVFLAQALGEYEHYDRAADEMLPDQQRIEPTSSGTYTVLKDRWRALCEAVRPFDTPD